MLFLPATCEGTCILVFKRSIACLISVKYLANLFLPDLSKRGPSSGNGHATGRGEAASRSAGDMGVSGAGRGYKPSNRVKPDAASNVAVESTMAALSIHE
jgi:hypothetical protein